MERKDGQMTELTPEQVAKITGGVFMDGAVACIHCKKTFIILSDQDRENYFRHVSLCRKK